MREGKDMRALMACGVAVVLVGVAACGGGTPSRQDGGVQRGDGAGNPLRRGSCRADEVSRGAVPVWARRPGAPSPAPPHVSATGSRVEAFLFVSPLRARMPANAANKVLWYFAEGVPPGTLRIAASRPGDGRSPRHVESDPGDGAGHVQRSRIRFPSSGCWRLTLSWGSRRAILDVDVRP